MQKSQLFPKTLTKNLSHKHLSFKKEARTPLNESSFENNISSIQKTSQKQLSMSYLNSTEPKPIKNQRGKGKIFKLKNSRRAAQSYHNKTLELSNELQDEDLIQRGHTSSLGVRKKKEISESFLQEKDRGISQDQQRNNLDIRNKSYNVNQFYHIVQQRYGKQPDVDSMS